MDQKKASPPVACVQAGNEDMSFVFVAIFISPAPASVAMRVRARPGLTIDNGGSSTGADMACRNRGLYPEKTQMSRFMHCG